MDLPAPTAGIGSRLPLSGVTETGRLPPGWRQDRVRLEPVATSWDACDLHGKNVTEGGEHDHILILKDLSKVYQNLCCLSSEPVVLNSEGRLLCWSFLSC